MAYVGKLLATGYVRSFTDSIYSATSSTIITYARFFNVNAGPERIDIYIHKSGQERIEIYLDTSLSSGGSFDLLTGGSEIVLGNGDTLEAAADDENSVGFVLCGAEFE